MTLFLSVRYQYQYQSVAKAKVVLMQTPAEEWISETLRKRFIDLTFELRSRNSCPLFDMVDAISTVGVFALGSNSASDALVYWFVIMGENVFERFVSLKFSVVWFWGNADVGVFSNRSFGTCICTRSTNLLSLIHSHVGLHALENMLTKK
jgi:hypothetical protein